MLAGGYRPAGYAPGFSAGLGSPQYRALSTTLAGLADVSDSVARAVQSHDRLGLEAANARAEELLARVVELVPTLTDEDRLLAGDELAGLAERLNGAARRNAYLIEQAWAVDAALMRLMMGVGKDGAYGEQPTPAYVDRQA